MTRGCTQCDKMLSNSNNLKQRDPKLVEPHPRYSEPESFTARPWVNGRAAEVCLPFSPSPRGEDAGTDLLQGLRA